jgi:hypothetical protein
LLSFDALRINALEALEHSLRDIESAGIKGGTDLREDGRENSAGHFTQASITRMSPAGAGEFVDGRLPVIAIERVRRFDKNAFNDSSPRGNVLHQRDGLIRVSAGKYLRSDS